ncbi:MAG: hypothetical protein WBH68_03105 [Erysipelotrichaceae bacterium]|jgi:hypothetical protein
MTKISKTKNRISRENIFIFLFLFILAWLFLLQSPLSIIGDGETGIDSSVFKTVALYMQSGFMPYKDVFDHKGPLIYIINYIGNIINYFNGVWYIELLFLTVTFTSIYKIAHIFTSSFNSILTVLLSSTPLFLFLEGGNFTEEYAMTFISVSLFIFIDYFQNNVINKKRLIICGICFASVLMLRPNMIALWIAFCLGVLFHCIKEKEYVKLGKFLLWFLFGMAIIIIPIVIWLLINNSFIQFWECYINFNLTYSSSMSEMNIIKKILQVFFAFARPPMIALAIGIIFYIVFKRKFIDVVYGFYFLIEILMVSMSGMRYGHYGMVFVPMISYPLAIGLEKLYEKINKKGVSIVTISLIIITLLLPNLTSLAKSIITPNRPKDDFGLSNINTTQNISTLILKEAKIDDTLSVYGSYTRLHVQTKLISPSKYIYQYPIGVVEPKILENYFKELDDNPPNWFVVSYGNNDEKVNEFINKHSYIEVENIDDNIVYKLR